MAQFEVPKGFDEIQGGVEVADAVYKLALSKPPYLKQNKAATGNNIVLELVVTGENSEVDGMQFDFYLPLPNDGDKDRRTRKGQPMADWKMEKIQTNVEALGGTIKGSTFNIPDQAICKANVKNEPSQNDPNEMWPGIVGDLMAVGPKVKPKVS